MKMRIQGPSLRLRLKQGEVAALAEQGRVHEEIVFGAAPGERMVYAVITSPGAEAVGVRYREGAVTVVVPEAEARAWASGDRVGLEGEHPVEGEETLHILVEKDFRCLHRRPREDETDSYPHPDA